MSFVVLSSVFCARNARNTASSSTSIKWPKEALEPLTDSQVVQLVRALPAMKGALRAAKWDTKPPKPGESQLATLTNLVEGMNVAGMDDSLRPNGGWRQIRPILYRVFAGTAAVSIDRAPQDMLERMKQDTTAGGRQNYSNFEFFKTATRQVPETTKQLVAKYQDQLQPLGSLGR